MAIDAKNGLVKNTSEIPPAIYFDIVTALRQSAIERNVDNVTVRIASTGETFQARLLIADERDSVLDAGHLYLEIIE